MKKILCLVLSLLLLSVPVLAEEAAYCFSSSDFEESLRGILIRKTPQEGVLMLESRVLQPGDVLTGEQARRMRFYGEQPEQLQYLPVFASGTREAVSLWIPGRENQAPVAQDSALETYQNLENSGVLRVFDPEQKELTVTLLQKPRRGTVTLEAGGKFTYTPKKNKVGRDSFSYEARDPEGGVSREATVVITILKPSESPLYQDTMGLSCSYSAEWMKNTGIFSAEVLGDARCFQPEKPVSRGEFLTMLLKTLNIAPEPELTAGLEEFPQWLQPYVAAALRSGLTFHLPDSKNWEEPIGAAEAEALAGEALERSVSVFSEEENPEDRVLSRAQAAELLYQVHVLRTTS